MNNKLIVVDMQNDFVNGALGTEEAEAIVPKVIAKIKDFDGEIIFTFDTHKEDYLATQEGGNLPVEHCIEGEDGWRLYPLIEELAESKKKFAKPTFGSRELGEYLAEENADEPIDSIELVGLCTDICVISNALLIKAFVPEVKILVDSSCCAGVTPESHENALSAMRMCQIEVL